MTYALGITLTTLLSVIGLGMTLVTLPGTWTILAGALLVELTMPEVFGWEVLAAMAAGAVLAEIVETFASAYGAKRAGGARRAGLGSIFGSLLGAVAGTILLPIPLVGTVVGAVVGAGVGAVALQLTKPGDEPRTRREHWAHASRVGVGAAKARFISTFVKAGIAVVMGAILVSAAVVR